VKASAIPAAAGFLAIPNNAESVDELARANAGSDLEG
jgi:hypothetical protein